jgi:hypothetical protein
MSFPTSFPAQLLAQNLRSWGQTNIPQQGCRVSHNQYALQHLLMQWLDVLPETVETMRIGWINTFQSAATVVRMLFLSNYIQTVTNLTHWYPVRIISCRRVSITLLLQS